MPRRLISILIPVYNESETIPLFLRALQPILEKEDYDFELLFVSDGSTDNTMGVLCAARERDARIRVIELSRNFGKEMGMAAGFQAASGAAVIPVDVDLQDPPELISAFLRKWEEGYEAVLGVRRLRQEDSVFKRVSAKIFYRIFKKLCDGRMVENAGDFRLLDRTVLDALNSLPERVRFTKGLYSWLGFRQAQVEYDRPRRVAGKSSWNSWKLWNFALDGITSFSTLPLRIWSYLGVGIAVCGFFYAIVLVARALFFGVDVPGYTSIMVAVLTLGGLILSGLGVLGEYMGRIFEEVKARPQYIVRSRIGFDKEEDVKNVTAQP